MDEDEDFLKTKYAHKVDVNSVCSLVGFLFFFRFSFDDGDADRLDHPIRQTSQYYINIPKIMCNQLHLYTTCNSRVN